MTPDSLTFAVAQHVDRTVGLIAFLVLHGGNHSIICDVGTA